MANRLADETSPYLRQHKDNPVDWWPWCDEAFEEAGRRDVPVFVSIGYATCHWCHVMAHESFEDDDVARRMNKAFVNIKVDREERPDVDDVYMEVCQAMTGRGGWPLNVALTPERKPWFAGTYFPKQSRGGHIGMLDLVPALQKAWREKRDDIEGQGDHLLKHLARPPADAGDLPGQEALHGAFEALKGAFDAEHGGFGRAPKFPSLHQVRFLLRMHLRGVDGALDMAETTLDGMARGGIRDHVGGGFHRYSTDARWHLPHFEKMLYDQGMALLAYGEAYMLTRKPLYEEVLRETASYLEREMRHDSGAFFAAEDADAEGEEGRFTTWPWDELLEVLDGDEELARALGAAPEGNFREEATGEPVERNILHAADAAALEGPLADRWEAAKPKLLARRDARVRPLRDEKVLTDWNGLAIAGLAVAGQALDDEGIIGLARGAMDGVLELQLDMPGGSGTFHWDRLRHVWCRGRKGGNVFLDDFAAMGLAFAKLASASFRVADSRWASRWVIEALRFEGPKGAFYRTDKQHDLPVRPLETHDGAIPSGKALLAEADVAVCRLLTGLEPRIAPRILEGVADSVGRHPAAHTGLLCVLADLLSPYAEVIVFEGRQKGILDAPDAARPMLDRLRRRAHPHIYALWTDGHDDWIGDDQYRTYLNDAFDRDGGPQAFLCRDGACERPVGTPEALDALLDRVLGTAQATQR